MSQTWLFDRAWTQDFTAIRKQFLAEFLDSAGSGLKLNSALDVGSAVGDFSQFLHARGLRVTGVDGRAENAAEARRRFPEIAFFTANAEDLPTVELGMFDLVLCFGLLYHLENPFRTIRQLFSVTNSVLILESMCLPGSRPMMGLFDECDDHDQSLNSVAFYPSESCLIKMLYRSGFTHVYRLRNPLPHELFTGTAWRKPTRTVLIAAKTAINDPHLSLAQNRVLMLPDSSDPWSVEEWNPWSTAATGVGRFWHRSLASLRMLRARVLRPFKKSLGS